MTLLALDHPATLHGAPVSRRVSRQATTRWYQAVRLGGLRFLVAALVVSAAFPPRAWDADTMLRSAQAQGPQALAGARALQDLLGSLAGQDELAKLNAVNQFFNRRIAFAADTVAWGQGDYWASPLELLANGRGDCEDYVIAKYFGLLAAGVPMARLRLVYVRATVGGPGGEVLAHMVLAHYSAPGAEPLILDNLISEMRPASRRSDLAPVFSFNGEGLWQGVGAQPAGDPVSRLSRWREVLAKARAEGFQ